MKIELVGDLMEYKIGVLGGGSWGTSLAILLSKGLRSRFVVKK